MTSLTYFTVTADFVPASAVGSLSGIVTFQMLVTQGDGLVAPTLTTPGIVVPTTTQGRITGGVLYGLDGSPGVSLLANTAVLSLSSTLYYRVSFADVVYTYPNSSAATQTVNLSAFTFAAETNAGTIDLSDVAPAAGALAAQVISLTSAEIVDATTLGRELLTAPDAAAALADLGIQTELALADTALQPLDGGTPASVGLGPAFDGGTPASVGLGATFDGGTVGIVTIEKPTALIAASQLTAQVQAAIGLANSAVQPNVLGTTTAPFGKLDTRYEPLEQFAILPSPYTLVSQTAAQKLLNTTTNGAITLPVDEYFFECAFSLTAMSASSGSFGFGFSGTATFTQNWLSVVEKSSLGLVGGAGVCAWATTNQTVLISVNTNQTGAALIKGSVNVTAAGTLIPQVSLTVAAAAVVGAGSYFRIQSVNSATAYSGAWS